MDRVDPLYEFDIITGEPIYKNPYKREMEGTPVLDGPDDKLDADAVMRKEYGDLLRTPDATMILMAILKELVMARRSK